MATQTTTLATSEACKAILTYDDLLLIASSVTLDNLGGDNSITFWITVSGVTQFKTVLPGSTAILTFTVPLAIISVGGSAIFSNLNSFGIGMGVDTGVF